MQAIVTRDTEGYTYIKYAEDKRPLKICPYFVDGIEREICLGRMVRCIEEESNGPEHIAKMTEPKFFALVERLATLTCKEFSPTKNWGVTKFEVRAIVLFVLYGGLDAGRWPDAYPMTDKTFVQDGLERDRR
ncbi:hypothetical protein M6D81_13900 [Paenibacillus sp. J5C_2022]|uniref:hypothetical protein n=1 Tax=Paenibacillus sp. J5C2022 TaxID=2977129 RepID=UPI0021D3D951|nr:hypothetical protein [Paenibacillus sp. J5C2022]MCU6709786.1 hypothetical protein [Paenibacillus sp. J5C2022]